MSFQEITVIGEVIPSVQFSYDMAGPHCLFVVDLDDDMFFNVTTRGLLAETCWREIKPELEICVIGTCHYIGHDEELPYPFQLLELRAQQVWKRNEYAIPYLLEGSQVDD